MKQTFRIAHITSWLSNQGGGIPPVLFGLARENMLAGRDCLIAGLQDDSNGSVEQTPGVKTVVGKMTGPKSFGFSRELKARLAAELKGGTVIHSHGLWMHSGMIARRVATKTKAPLVISPHGMLEPWALANSKWKKRLAARLFERRNLRSAGCLHALCEAEARNFRNYGLQNPIAVIPNGIDLAEFRALPAYQCIETDYPELKGTKRLLFLSRIHPKKGLEHLLKAWSGLKSEFPEWRLVIAGNGQPSHEQSIRELTGTLGLGEKVMFVGAVQGTAKLKLLAGADAFVLPSFSEGFSMAILEAAAAGLPILLTPQCNFPELRAAGGAFEAQPEANECETGLRKLLGLTVEERSAMGSRARSLIHTNYSWAEIATRLAAVYSWLLKQGPRPDSVFIEPTYAA